jgi:hypothetical protein
LWYRSSPRSVWQKQLFDPFALSCQKTERAGTEASRFFSALRAKTAVHSALQASFSSFSGIPFFSLASLSFSSQAKARAMLLFFPLALAFFTPTLK